MNTHLISEVHSWLTIIKQRLTLSVIRNHTKTTVRYCNKSQCMAKIKVATIRARCGEHYLISVLGRSTQVDLYKFRVTQSYMARPCLKQQQDHTKG